MLQCCHIVHCLEILDPYRPVSVLVVKEKPTVGSPYFGAFPSSGISRATKDVNVHFFIHSFTENSHLQQVLSITWVNSWKSLKPLHVIVSLL